MRPPLLVYDGDCAFCRRWVERWRARTGDRVEYRPFQQRGLLRGIGMPRDVAERAVHLVAPDGHCYEAADAVFRALDHAPELRTAARLGRLPIVRAIANWVYRRVSHHRVLASRIDRLLVGQSTEPPRNALVRSVFLRALGGVYLIAFSSLRRQVLGLYGQRGILPVREYLDAVASVTEDRLAARLHRTPSVFWLDASDRALVRGCTAGQLAGVLLALGIAPRAMTIAAWALYLSFVSVGRDFLSFQWDSLLLETGLDAAIVASPRSDETPPWLATLLMRTLACRVQFESGFAKLASRDPSWRTGAACCHHFTTQPLPTRLGWHVHQLPRSALKLATFAVLAIELVVPWLAFAPRRVRRAAFATLGGLQLAIAATGNYGFFNVLTMVDNLWLLDDGAMSRALRVHRPRATRAPWWRRLATAAMVVPVLGLAVAELVGRIRRRPVRSSALAWIDDKLAPLFPVSRYGLFAVMTTERPEIVIEGSNDGQDWREYRFRYKPVDVHTPPRTAAPHQPRLDWQMWFAAMQSPPVWFGNLLTRLLEGSPDVLELLDGNPFPDGPPVYVRAVLYDYRMTDRQTRRRTGAWWHREARGVYVPAIRR